MTNISLKIASPDELSRVTDTLAGAFEHDPVMMAVVLPDRRRARLRRLLRPFLAHGIAAGQVTTTSGYQAVALWGPPLRWKTPPGLLVRSLVPMIRAAGSRLPRMLNGMLRMEHEHPAGPPHWYLHAIGTLPEEQGKGYGSILLGHGVAQFDVAGLPAYLESSNPRNLPFYQRHGFRIVRELSYRGIPTVRAMWREAFPLTEKN
ncbi:MAG: GNAT family N-acetyltransferase [Dactylosporangium sp.]|nr:GNAT family N-acetyltransferase [Dactylosporangium sp.]NNJ60944.1 GNAT family N-acetyltransferase [Dactylosporangium sp.]